MVAWSFAALSNIFADAPGTVHLHFGPSPVPLQTVPLTEGWTTYSASVAIYVIAVGFLVSVLLIGGFLIVNLGLMSKRKVDQDNLRGEGDIGLLKHITFPNEPDTTPHLPAEEDDENRVA